MQSLLSSCKSDETFFSQRMPSAACKAGLYVVGSKETMHSNSIPKVRFSGLGMLAGQLKDIW